MKNANKMVVSFVFCLLFGAFGGQVSTGQDSGVKDVDLRKLYNRVRVDLDPDDYTKREGTVSGIRVYYNLCGVDQMVTVIGTKRPEKQDEIVYTLEVASANIPGSTTSARIVNRRPLKSSEVSSLLEYIDSKEIYELPETSEEKETASSALIFAEKWSKSPHKHKIIIRDFYESRALDGLMLIMYQLAWNPAHSGHE